MQEQQKYKYNIVVDGYAWAARLPFVLSNGFLTLYNTIFVSWTTGMLKPFHHYIPITQDYQDMEKVLKYLDGVEGDLVGEEIAARGMEYSQNHLRNDDKIAYILLVILEYAELSDFVVY